MPSPAIKRVVQVLGHCHITTSVERLPIFLLPAASKKRRTAERPSRRPRLARSFASVTSRSPLDNDEYTPARIANALPVEAETLAQSSSRKSLKAWAAILDLYLPPELRAQMESSISFTQDERPQPISTLHLVLSRARANANGDVLCYLGLQAGRWEAVIWLVKAMMASHPGHPKLVKQSNTLPSLLWTSNKSLDEATAENIKTGCPPPSRISLEHLGGSLISMESRSLGQIWQSLGYMILEAEDRSAKDPIYHLIMSNVCQILALLHHIDALPDTIYNYAPAKDESVLRRPPTIYFLSPRIMSVLSDIAWKVYWDEERAKAVNEDYDLPAPKVQPQMPKVGAEVWLELILWACVEGGWIMEGAWIVMELERRQSNQAKRWSTISWKDIREMKAPELDWTTKLKLQINRSRLNQATGISIANKGTGDVQMGERTISSEVVMALMDGLINTSSCRPDIDGNKVRKVTQCFAVCRNLLERNRVVINGETLNNSILRIIESTGLVAMGTPGILQEIVDLKSTDFERILASEERSRSSQTSDIDHSAATLGLLHIKLDSLTREANLQGSLETVRTIQNVIDANRDKYINEFAAELRDLFRQGIEGIDLVGKKSRESGFPMLYPRIPTYTLARFLDLLTDSKAFEIGDWLLFNDDIDGGILDSSLYYDQNFQPALLRFTIATANSRVLARVLEKLREPLSEDVLHALFHCHVVLGRWDAVEGLLVHFQNSEGMRWRPSDVMAIAAAILKMEHGAPEDHSGSLSQAMFLLRSLVQGRYDSPHDPSNSLDLTQARTANQLKRILWTVPGRVSEVGNASNSYVGTAHSKVTIPSTAFNILLESIVECYGSYAGVRMWHLWCMHPIDTSQDLESMDIKVVSARTYMLSNILRPIVTSQERLPRDKLAEILKTSSSGSEIQGNLLNENSTVDGRWSLNDERRDMSGNQSFLNDENHKILKWGVRMYRKFGLSTSEIRDQISGAFSGLSGRS